MERLEQLHGTYLNSKACHWVRNDTKSWNLVSDERHVALLLGVTADTVTIFLNTM
jgi:hypothetical protein